jgi:hypothetical protein
LHFTWSGVIGLRLKHQRDDPGHDGGGHGRRGVAPKDVLTMRMW